MKTENRQISSAHGRSTKKKKAGLSLLQSSTLFKVVGDSYVYYNEVSSTIVKNTSDFIARLISRKFKYSVLVYVRQSYGFDLFFAYRSRCPFFSYIRRWISIKS